jgi:hypothetical protein
MTRHQKLIGIVIERRETLILWGKASARDAERNFTDRFNSGIRTSDGRLSNNFSGQNNCEFSKLPKLCFELYIPAVQFRNNVVTQ